MSGMAGPGDQAASGAAIIDTTQRYLTFHTPDEWRAATKARLIELGCSVEYAEATSSLITEDTFTYVGHKRRSD